MQQQRLSGFRAGVVLVVRCLSFLSTGVFLELFVQFLRLMLLQV